MVPAAAVSGRTAPPAAAAAVVDVHCHLEPAELSALIEDIDSVRLEDGAIVIQGRRFASPAGLTRPDKCRQRLGEDGWAIVSPPPALYLYHLDPPRGTRFSQQLNDGLLALADRYPRTPVLGWLPLQSAQASVAEARRLAGEPRVVGVVVGTDIPGGSLAAPALDPVWALLAEAGLAVLVHPNADPLQTTDRIPVRSTVLGFPAATMLAVLELLFSESAVWRAGTRLCLTHGGGLLPAALPRVRRAVTAAVRGELDRRLEQIWVDSVVFDVGALARSVFGEDRLLPGSDWPFDLSLSEAELRGFQCEDAMSRVRRWCPRIEAWQ